MCHDIRLISSLRRCKVLTFWKFWSLVVFKVSEKQFKIKVGFLLTCHRISSPLLQCAWTSALPPRFHTSSSLIIGAVITHYVLHVSMPCLPFFRNYMSSRRLSRHWSTRFHPQHPITSRCGRRLRPHTAMSVKGYCGASPVRACAAQSVALNATRSARTCSMQIVYKVRNEIHSIMLPWTQRL